MTAKQPNYFPESIETEVQALWEQAKCFSTAEDLHKEKFYCLAMFPYPSGVLHIGHVRNYTLSDVVARYQRMLGKNVLHPIGWDAFGLPAENAAIKHGVDPKAWTEQNIADMRAQFKRLGYSYDWKRELATCDASYYQWEQWLFLQLYAKGLVYKKKAKVNWDPVDKTVLANEQVIDGKGWRSGATVEQLEIPQWFIKISAYADELLTSLNDLPNWPKQVVSMQKNWIGKSTGVEVKFVIDELTSLYTFTTRVDTIFGVTHLCISPDHPLSQQLAEHDLQIQAFISDTKHTKLAEAELENIDKLAIKTTLKAQHPLTKQPIDIWIANYILAEYGTGVVMAVPAHCKRDWEMAQKYDVHSLEVVTGAKQQDWFAEDGILTNSGEFSGLPSAIARDQISQKLTELGLGSTKVNFRLRDWGISRQRYWGTPIPMINCDNCGAVPVPAKDLPVVLPNKVTLDGTGSPLANHAKFYHVICPKCGSDAHRETDTFDTFVNSSWYYARFASFDQKNAMLDNRAKYWTPVDYYIGGIEHAVLHLLYARFFHKILKNEGLLNSQEPFKQLLTLGMVHNQGLKMSKSAGNSISPNDIIAKFGADTLRLYIIFAAPPEQAIEWSDSGIDGAHKFLKKLWAFSFENEVLAIYHESNKDTLQGHIYWDKATTLQKDNRKQVYDIFKQMDYDYQRSQFNTVVSGCMKLLNHLQKLYQVKADLIDKLIIYEGYITLIKALSPITPHICQKLWQQLGFTDLLVHSKWPSIPKDALKTESVIFVVQFNGKLKGKVTVPSGSTQEQVEALVMQESFVQNALNTRKLQKTIVVAKRKLVNLVFLEACPT